MPIYEYYCPKCKKDVTIFFLSFSDAREETAICPECGEKNLERILSSVSVIKERRSGSQAADNAHNSVKGEDPADFGDDFKEVKSRLEKGESPTSVEKSMRKRVGESMQTH
jgi:putative FmdB family regulatory protein